MQKKIVSTDLLDIAYFENGPQDGPVLLLLHGWPDEALTFEHLSAHLAQGGYRTIVPWLRGFGDTVFRHADTLRSGNSSMLALDAIQLMDALQIEKFGVIGHDWGSNIGESLAVNFAERVTSLAQLSTPPRLGGIKTPPFGHAQLEWYHWFQATKLGAEAVKADHIGFARMMWNNWSPPGWYTEEQFQKAALCWTSDDWADVTIHSYRSRWGEAPPDPLSQKLEDAVRNTKKLSLPAIYIQGEEDGVNPPRYCSDVGDKFDGPFEHVILSGVGHFPTREAPDELCAILKRHLGNAKKAMSTPQL